MQEAAASAAMRCAAHASCVIRASRARMSLQRALYSINMTYAMAARYAMTRERYRRHLRRYFASTPRRPRYAAAATIFMMRRYVDYLRFDFFDFRADNIYITPTFHAAAVMKKITTPPSLRFIYAPTLTPAATSILPPIRELPLYMLYADDEVILLRRDIERGAPRHTFCRRDYTASFARAARSAYARRAAHAVRQQAVQRRARTARYARYREG